ncbi:MAG: NADH-quinone oxidoreductase subunit A [Verrucomicrobiae bacterium]|nr:NADH-quinone oxidoreductase subunit A [Verrucomicrobiae bacterium]
MESSASVNASVNELQNYLPVGIMLLVALLFATGALLFQWMTSQKGRRNAAKDSAYECGVPTEFPAHAKFSVKFYLVAMLFILFDLEVVFMYPWAVIFKKMLVTGPAILCSMASFVGLLLVGYLYAWKKGAFDWK